MHITLNNIYIQYVSVQVVHDYSNVYLYYGILQVCAMAQRHETNQILTQNTSKHMVFF